MGRTGFAQPKAWRENGAALAAARKRKERRYPELVRSSRSRLVVVAQEIGGRWSEEAFTLVDQLARAKAREAPWVLRGSALFSWLRRWTTLVSVAAQDALATTLLTGDAVDLDGADGNAPELCSVVSDNR